MRAQFLKFVMLAVVLLAGWMMWAALSAGKAQTMDGFKVGQSVEAAENRCAQFKGRTYTWVEGRISDEDTMAACVADIQRGETETTADYRWLQTHPAFFIFGIKDNVTVAVLTVWFEPEAWLKKKRQIKKYPIIEKRQKTYSNGVAYSAPVRYNKKADVRMQAFVIEPDANAVWLFDDEHAFVLKERIYAIDMWNPNVVQQ